MKPILFIAALCVIALGGCSPKVETTKAQTAATSRPPVTPVQFTPFVPNQPVLALRRNQQMLAPVLTQMPRGGVSEFFGVCKGQFKSASTTKDGYLMVHLYAIPTSGRSEGRRRFSLFLDLLTSDLARTPTRPRRLNHIDLTQLPCLNGNWAHDSDSASNVDLMWVDSLQQQIPLLKLQMSGTVMSGIAGCYGLVVFPDGLQSQAVAQSFETHDQIMGGINISFSRDRRGFLVVRQDTKSYDMDFDKQQTTEKLTGRTYFDWNGRAFVARMGSGSTTPVR